MPTTTLSPEATNASKAAALLAMQVKKDLVGAGFTSSNDLYVMVGAITAAILTTAGSGGATLEGLATRTGR